jgi:hypothetical protein
MAVNHPQVDFIAVNGTVPKRFFFIAVAEPAFRYR